MTMPTPGTNGATASPLDVLRTRVHARTDAPKITELRALVEEARSAEAPRGEIRIAIVHSYTSDLLDPWLELAGALEGFSISVHHAPYGLALGEAQPQSELIRFAPDLTLFLLQPGDLAPGIADPVASLSPDGRNELLEEAATQAEAFTAAFRAHLPGRIILTLLPSHFRSDLGLYDAVSEASERSFSEALKARIGRVARETLSATTFLDLDDLLAELGRERFFDRRNWYFARFPFAPRAALELARRVVAHGVVIKRPKLKVIALDADNTLWGGVIGEDGLEGIALGPDYPGRCFVDFQRRILGLQQRGFILALCSKNNPADVEQVFREHPHMLLKESHFAAMQVNWNPKIDNLNALAEELNVGVDSFILVDDSDYECAAVRRELPQVEVVQTPSRPIDVPFCLDRVARLEILSLTAEDRKKTAMYAEERERRELKRTMEGQGIDLGQYLRSLGMRMSVRMNDAAQTKRLAQLTQKTNQFNLTTRRYDEAAMQDMIENASWTVSHFSLADSFGDSGVVGLALIRHDHPHSATLDSFMMSCRVIGREAEGTFLDVLLAGLQERGVRELIADYIPTPKNVLARNFLADEGFEPTPDGRWRRAVDGSAAVKLAERPILVEVTRG